MRPPRSVHPDRVFQRLIHSFTVIARQATGGSGCFGFASVWPTPTDFLSLVIRRRLASRWRAVGLVPLLVLLAALTPPAAADHRKSGLAGSDHGEVRLLFFYGTECIHCADARPFLVGLESKYAGLVIEHIEVWHNEANRARLKKLAAEMGFNPIGTPVIVIGDRHWVGFNATIAREIEETLAAAFEGRQLDVRQRAVLEVPILGTIDLSHSSLVVSALVIGFVDGINPCSLWVLSVLLAIVLHSGSRGRVALVGTTFLIVTTAMYGLYMTGMYSALDYVGHLTWIRLAVAAIALVFGLIHTKDFFFFKEGPTLSIDEARKPGIYARMRQVAASDRSIPGIIGGTVALAVGVSLLETPCTAGLPLLWTSLLASQHVPLATAIALFGVYMFVFLLDEFAVFGAAVISLRASKMQEQHGRLLKLVSGVVMLTLAVAMMVAPRALESVIGTVQVFAIAAALVAVIWSVHRLFASLHRRTRRSI